MTYKNASFSSINNEYDESYIEQNNVSITSRTLLWDMNSIKADSALCGLSGSPTKVKKIESVVLKSANIKIVENNESSIASMIHELEADHTLG